MGSFEIDTTSEPGILILRLVGALTVDEMRAFARAHNAAVAAFGSTPYRVFCDLHEMSPVSPEAAKEMERAKAYSASLPNFQGSAVLVSSQLIAMQHRRTSTDSGVIDTELISDDPEACREHLRRVQRAKGPRQAG
jgi:hypothetical protein